MNNYYIEQDIDPKKVVEQSGDRLVVCDSKKPFTQWWDIYELLKKQDSKVDKSLFRGRYYRLVSSVCEDKNVKRAKFMLN